MSIKEPVWYFERAWVLKDCHHTLNLCRAGERCNTTHKYTHPTSLLKRQFAHSSTFHTILSPHHLSVPLPFWSCQCQPSYTPDWRTYVPHPVSTCHTSRYYSTKNSPSIMCHLDCCQIVHHLMASINIRVQHMKNVHEECVSMSSKKLHCVSACWLDYIMSRPAPEPIGGKF